MSKHITNFINVTRLNKPIGFFLLFWPCTWGLSLAFYFDKNFYTLENGIEDYINNYLNKKNYDVS